MFAWSAPEECPSQQQVEAEIARLVGGDLRLRDGNDLRADVSVSGGPPWSADLTTLHAGRVGRRRLESPSCQAAADAVALIIALSIDPDVAAAGGQASPARASAGSPGAGEQEPAAAHPRQRLLTRARRHIAWRGRRRWARRRVGRRAVAVELRWSLRAAARSGRLAAFRRRRPIQRGRGVTDRLRRRRSSQAGVWTVRRGGGGRVSATGYGATAGFSKDAPWLALGGGVFASLMVSKHLRTSVEVDALASLYRPDYVFDEIPGVIFKAPAVGGRALIDLSWQF